MHLRAKSNVSSEPEFRGMRRAVPRVGQLRESELRQWHARR